MDAIVVLLILGFVFRSILKQKTTAQKTQRPQAMQQPPAMQRTPQRTQQSPRPAAQPKPVMQPEPNTAQPRHREYVPTQAQGYAGEGDKARYHVREVSCQSVGHTPAQHASASAHKHIESVPTQAQGYAGEGDRARYHSREVSCESAGHEPPVQKQPKLACNPASFMQAVIWSQVLDKPRALRGGRRF